MPPPPNAADLPRVLEPEVMDAAEEAADYDAMDHREVNARFVGDLLAAGCDGAACLDVGAGTALIPIEHLRRQPSARVAAVDLSLAMLRRGQANLAAAGETVEAGVLLVHADAKALPFCDGAFRTVYSNSIVHHIPQPLAALAEMVRVCRPGGLLFVRDLYRPADAAEVERLVETYAGGATARQAQLFRQSFHAALTLAEIQAMVASLGFPPESVQMTTDRHWTWSARRPAK